MDHPRQNGAFGQGREGNRAERFEEEKKRIVESCFNKRDVDGSSKIYPVLPCCSCCSCLPKHARTVLGADVHCAPV